MDSYTPPTEPWLVVLHEDRDLVVLDKPSGLLSVPGRQPGWEDSAQTRARQRWSRATAVHRLDMDTSGLLVLSLRKKAERALVAQFRERQVRKTYMARVWGQPPDEGTVDLPLSRVGGIPPRNEVDTSQGKPALTRYRVLERQEGSALVELRPATGRSHQLRVHMLALGHPILGDRIYAHAEALVAAPRLLLHAWRMELHHPWSGAPLSFEAPLPFG